MGCTTSKLDDLPAVAVCRHRCTFLDEAIHRRYAFSQAQAAYLHSLKHLASSLTPLLNNQPDPTPPLAPAIPHSGPHLDFNSDSDHQDSESDSESLHHHHLDTDDHFSYAADNGTLGLSYMKPQTTPSSVYEQRPPGTQTLHRTDFSSYQPYSNSTPPPPPPPPPPTTSTWDFLNPFESFEPNWRDDEGIPELESEDELPEIVKEVDEKSKSLNDSRHHSKRISDDGADPQNPPVAEDKKVVMEEKEETGNPVDVAISKNFRNDGEVLKEIQIQFERASESGDDLAKILEVGKLPYNRKHSAYQDSTKMLNVTGLLSTASPAQIIDPEPEEYSDSDGDFEMGSTNHSSTLKKIYFWEMKLYHEVKVEEKLRTLHGKQWRKLKKLDEKGAEADKINETRNLVRSLSTKIKIAIQVVDKISVKINILRDEELWPQLKEIIQGLGKMWKSMAECHESQNHDISQAKKLDTIMSLRHLTEADIEASLQLQREVINWTLRFSCWVTAQKDYVRALNNWLLKSFLYEPEETCDGVAPFSPGRVGAPPVFVACNHWSQALEMVSEKEVVESMRDFATNVLRVQERDKSVVGQRKIEKEIASLEKMMMEIFNVESGGVVYPSDTSTNAYIGLQSSMQRVFEAMEKFTSSLVTSYEDLSQYIEKAVV